MTNEVVTEIDLWSRVTDMLGDVGKRLGPQWSSQLHRDPIQLALTLAWAKFAAKMACVGRSVLELGCDEGIRSPILSEHADCYVGLDSNRAAIAAAEVNWNSPRRSFVASALLRGSPRVFQSVVCHDIRSIYRGASFDSFVETVSSHLDSDGLCVLGLGTSHEMAQDDICRLGDACARAFRRVLHFGMNDGLVHTRCTPAAEHVILLGICPQSTEQDH